MSVKGQRKAARSGAGRPETPIDHRAPHAAQGSVIRAIRKASGFTQAEAARRAKCSPQRWNGWERGIHRPDLYIVADALGCSVDALRPRGRAT